MSSADPARGFPGALRHVLTPVLDIAYFEAGPPDGIPIVMLHGFPYDVLAFAAAARELAGQGHRVLVPYLRGYGPTRFLEQHVKRSGEQAAIAGDLLDFLDALGLPHAMLAGFDWGARAACIVAALWPERVTGLVTCGGYTILGPPDEEALLPPWLEHAIWYQRMFARPGARARFARQRTELCRYLWQIWSPTRDVDEETFAATAVSFENPDFDDVVIHSYQHRLGVADGDSRYADTAERAQTRPEIFVPSVALHGGAGIAPAPSDAGPRFTGPHHHEVLAGVGHNVPHEAPEALVRSVLNLISVTGEKQAASARLSMADIRDGKGQVPRRS